MAGELTDSVRGPTDLIALCRAIAESSPIPTAEIDPATNTITCVNFAFSLLTGKSKQELVGSPLDLIVPDTQGCLALLDLVEEQGEPLSHVGEQSGPLSAQWTYTVWPVLAGRKRALAFILQVTEATSAGKDAVLVNQALLLGALRQHELIEAAELLNTQLRAEMLARKAAEKALVHSERLSTAGRMAAVLAHEINNPLAGLMDLLYLVRTMNDIPAEALQYVEQADAEVKRIAHITRQTLGFYREPGASAAFRVRGLLESILDLLRARVRSREATVQLQCAEELTVFSTESELRQVLSNLLLNSLDALTPGGRVVLRASTSRDPRTHVMRLRLTLSDDGCGIEPTRLAKIFDAFYTTKGAVGNGLGLWVCKQLVDKHGGSIRVRSNANGPYKGTTFVVAVPISSI